MIYGRIYLIQNLVNGMVYVGQTVRSLKIRYNQHKTVTSKSYLSRVINKHGIDNFFMYEIDFAYEKESLDKLEQKYIDLYQCMSPNGYNCKDGGASGKHTEESKKKISEAKKNPSDEARKKISETHKGKIVSAETRKKISEAQKNRSDETRKKISEAGKGRIFSAEHKAKLSEAKKGKVLSAEHKAKLSEAQKGRIVSDETRKKLSESNKGKKHTKRQPCC